MSTPRNKSRNKYYSGHVYWYSYYSNPQNGVDTVTESFTDRLWDYLHTPPFVEADTLRLLKAEGEPGRVVTADYWISNKKHGRIARIPLVPLLDWTDVWTFPTPIWITEALSKVQDTGPIVDIPLNIAELKDIPRTLRTLFRTAIRKGKIPEDIADAHLTNQFGIQPLVSTAIDLLSLQRSIADRMRRHRRKYRTHRARGRLNTPASYDWTAWWNPVVDTYVPKLGYSWKADVSRSTASEQWYSAKIEPQVSLPDILAESAANPTGIGNASLATMWNLIPWSFLVDYFTNLGDALELIGNRMPYRVTELCLMCTATIKCKVVPRNETYRITSSQRKNGTMRFIEKRRFVFNNPTPAIGFTPVLSGKQVANLVALAVGLRR